MNLLASLQLTMQALYVHEVNCGLQSFHDGGWTVWIGDDMNGIRVEETFDPEDFHEIPAWLVRQAQVHYPNLKSLH